MSTEPPVSRAPPDEDDVIDVDADELEVLDDGTEIEKIAGEPTNVGVDRELIEALRESDGSSAKNPLAAIGEAAADLPEGIDAMFDSIKLPSIAPPPTGPPTDPPPAATAGDTDPSPPLVQDPDEMEWNAFWKDINERKPKPPQS